MGDMYIEKWSSISMTSSRVMPETEMPGAALNRRVTQSLNFPAVSVTLSATCIDIHLSFRTVQGEPQRHVQRPAISRERVLRPFHRRLDAIAVEGHGDSRAALGEALA
jgi:hypothetical protein